MGVGGVGMKGQPPVLRPTAGDRLFSDLSLLESSIPGRRGDKGRGKRLIKGPAWNQPSHKVAGIGAGEGRRMEVLSVDLPMCSEARSTQQEIALEIERTHNLTLSMQFSSGQLLSNYVHHQGVPFGDPDFNPTIQPFPGLPLPTLSTTEWLGLTDKERLQQNASAFSNLQVYLASVKCQQMDLNPLEDELHRKLDSSRLHCLGLENNLKSIMSSLGIVPGPVVPAEPLESDNTFLMKLTGYYVCHLFQDWVNRCEKDIALLTKKYPV